MQITVKTIVFLSCWWLAKHKYKEYLSVQMCSCDHIKFSPRCEHLGITAVVLTRKKSLQNNSGSKCTLLISEIYTKNLWTDGWLMWFPFCCLATCIFWKHDHLANTWKCNPCKTASKENCWKILVGTGNSYQWLKSTKSILHIIL